LHFLAQLRWRAIDLTRRPERLGALDIWYPSPVKLRLRTLPVTVSVEDRLSFAVGRNISIRIRLYGDGLEVGALTVDGSGPHEVADDADAVDGELRIDDVVLDRTECSFLRRMSIGVGAVGAQQNLQMSKPGKRAGTTVPIGPRRISTTTIGSMRTTGVNPARALAHLWRDQRRHPDDTAERLYDPRQTDSISKALSDLQRFKAAGTAARIIAVDRYSLNRDALEAVVAIAVAHTAGVVVDIATKFEVNSAGDAAGASPLAQRVMELTAIAKTVASRLGMRIRLHKIDGVDLHDRFLIVDERIWHVGPSFNAVGEALSAVVEMRDLAAKAQLLDIIEPQLQAPVFDSTSP
jgi:hypothetical protein